MICTFVLKGVTVRVAFAKNNKNSSWGAVNDLKVRVKQGKGFEFNVIRLFKEYFL